MPGSSGWPRRDRPRTPPGWGNGDSRRDAYDSYRPNGDSGDRYGPSYDAVPFGRGRRDDGDDRSSHFRRDDSGFASGSNGRGGSTFRPVDRAQSRNDPRAGPSHSHDSNRFEHSSVTTSEARVEERSGKKGKGKRDERWGDADSKTTASTFPQSTSAPAIKRKYSDRDGPSPSAGPSSTSGPSKALRPSSSTPAQLSLASAATGHAKSGYGARTVGNGNLDNGYNARGETSARGGSGSANAAGGNGQAPPRGPTPRGHAVMRGGVPDRGRGRGGLSTLRGGRGGGTGTRPGPAAPAIPGLPPVLIADPRPIATKPIKTFEVDFSNAPVAEREPYKKYIPGEGLVFSYHPNRVEDLPPDIEHRASLAAAKEKREREAREAEEAEVRAEAEAQRAQEEREEAERLVVEREKQEEERRRAERATREKEVADKVAREKAAVREAARARVVAEEAAKRRAVDKAAAANARVTARRPSTPFDSSDEEIEIIENPASRPKMPVRVPSTNAITTTKNDQRTTKTRDKGDNGNMQTTPTRKDTCNGVNGSDIGLTRRSDNAKASTTTGSRSASGHSASGSPAPNIGASFTSGSTKGATLPASTSAPLVNGKHPSQTGTVMTASQSAPVITSSDTILPPKAAAKRDRHDPDSPPPRDRYREALKKFKPISNPALTSSIRPGGKIATMPAVGGADGTSAEPAAASGATCTAPAPTSASKAGPSSASRPTAEMKQAAKAAGEQKAQSMADEALQNAIKRIGAEKQDPAGPAPVPWWEERDKRRKAAAEKAMERQVQAMNERFNARYRAEQHSLLEQGSNEGSSSRTVEHTEREVREDSAASSSVKRRKKSKAQRKRERQEAEALVGLEETAVNNGHGEEADSKPTVHQPTESQGQGSQAARKAVGSSIPGTALTSGRETAHTSLAASSQPAETARKPLVSQPIKPPSSPDYSTPQTPPHHVSNLPAVGMTPLASAHGLQAACAIAPRPPVVGSSSARSPKGKVRQSPPPGSSRGPPVLASPADVKPNVADLEMDAADPPETDGNRPPADEGVLWFKVHELPAKCYDRKQKEAQRAARIAWSHAKDAELLSEGKRSTRTWWASDGMSVDWVRIGSAADAALRGRPPAKDAPASGLSSEARNVLVGRVPAIRSTAKEEDGVDELDSSDDEREGRSLAEEQAKRRAPANAASKSRDDKSSLFGTVTPLDGFRPPPHPTANDLGGDGRPSGSNGAATQAHSASPHALPNGAATAVPADTPNDPASVRAKRLAELAADVESAKRNLARHYQNKKLGTYSSKEIRDGLAQDLFEAADALAEAMKSEGV